jgi:hypothetical protein
MPYVPFICKLPSFPVLPLAVVVVETGTGDAPRRRYDSELNGVQSIVTVGYRAIVISKHYLVVFVQRIGI